MYVFVYTLSISGKFVQQTLRGPVEHFLVSLEQTALPCKEISIHRKFFFFRAKLGQHFPWLPCKETHPGFWKPQLLKFIWCLLSAPVILTRRDWCDVALFFSFPFFWLLGACSLRALESCVPEGIYDSQSKGTTDIWAGVNWDLSGGPWPVTLLSSIAMQRWPLIKSL